MALFTMTANGPRIGDGRALNRQCSIHKLILKKKGKSSMKHFRPAIANALLVVVF
jgi:hypothetical protein